MKKTKKFGSSVLISLIIAMAVALSGCSNESVPFADNRDKSEKALKIYAESVENLKNEKNFDLKLTTGIKLKDIDCSMSIFNSILKKVFASQLDKIEDDVIIYSFADGTLTTDDTIVPSNVVQPVNSDIDKKLFDGVTSSYIVDDDGLNSIYFSIGEETASMEEFAGTFEKLEKELGIGFENYDIHKKYPEMDTLAKYHSNFIDIMSVAPRVKNLMDMNAHSEEMDEEVSEEVGILEGAVSLENGMCHLGETVVTAIMDEDNRLKTVIFNAPFGMNCSVNFMHSNFKAAIYFEITQTYEYSYAD